MPSYPNKLPFQTSKKSEVNFNVPHFESHFRPELPFSWLCWNLIIIHISIYIYRVYVDLEHISLKNYLPPKSLCGCKKHSYNIFLSLLPFTSPFTKPCQCQYVLWLLKGSMFNSKVYLKINLLHKHTPHSRVFKCSPSWVILEIKHKLRPIHSKAAKRQSTQYGGFCGVANFETSLTFKQMHTCEVWTEHPHIEQTQNQRQILLGRCLYFKNGKG